MPFMDGLKVVDDDFSTVRLKSYGLFLLYMTKPFVPFAPVVDVT